MGIGQDAMVLTQTTESRSVGLLSQSFNMGKKVFETPIISYCKEGPLMKVDTSVNSEAEAELYLNEIKDSSRFNEYYIGALFCAQEFGTHIHIWNLNKCDSDYCLDWQDGKDTGLEGDIIIRSMNSRLSEGQIKKVPLEYSLRSYLEVIFLDANMEISVQGSVVQPRMLEKALDNSVQIKSVIMGRSVHLTLGQSNLEYERKNCGIFLYWHGRLIENGVLHFVNSDKQKFFRSAAYVELEAWLGQEVESYSNEKIQEKRISESSKSAKMKCDKCQKWRNLGCFDISSFKGQNWYCFTPPYNKSCIYPESPDHGESSVGSKRLRECSLPGESSCSRGTVVEDACKKRKRVQNGPQQKVSFSSGCN